MTNQSQPDQQDGDGLLPCPCPICRSTDVQTFERQEGLFVVSCENDDCILTVEAVGGSRKEAIRRWNTRATPQPTRDAAEGAESGDDEFGYFELGRSFYEEFTRLSNHGNFKGFICGCSPVEILVHLINERDEALAAPPKPAPDAMREALSALEPFTKLGGGQNPRDAAARLYYAAYYDLPGDTVVYENSGAYITADDVRTARRVFNALFHQAPHSSSGDGR